MKKVLNRNTVSLAMSEASKIIRNKSEISYGYVTIKMTQSRIDKGLIAIPISLATWFPKHSGIVYVYLGDSSVMQQKTYSSYDSSTRECRIGGVREWFDESGIKSGDEIVIQVIDKANFVYRLVPERKFVTKTQELQHRFDKSETEIEATENVDTIGQWVYLDKMKVVLNEFKRLVNTMPLEDRKYAQKRDRTRERLPAGLRSLLEGIYHGHCQVCDFWFLTRDNKPYFETHHLNPLYGHHPKNIIVVCGNCHNQFEHANVHHDFNNDGWLTGVSFNERRVPVKQVVLDVELEDSFKELYI